MSESLSISSRLMTQLLTWRNSRDYGREVFWDRTGKVVSAELGLLILTTTAVVETVAYSAMALLSLIFATAVALKPSKFFACQLVSSSFTVLWGIASALIYNPFYNVVETKESAARSYAFSLFECLVPETDLFFEQEESYRRNTEYARNLYQFNREPQDYSYVFDLPLLDEMRVEQDAAAFYKELLTGASKDTLTLFKEMDAEIFMFVLTKAIFSYVAGLRKTQPLPVFFNAETNLLIDSMRKDLKSGELVRELELLTSNPTRFESSPKNIAIKRAFNRLKNIASEEQQGCTFIEKYWGQAAKLVSLPR